MTEKFCSETGFYIKRSLAWYEKTQHSTVFWTKSEAVAYAEKALDKQCRRFVLLRRWKGR